MTDTLPPFSTRRRQFCGLLLSAGALPVAAAAPAETPPPVIRFGYPGAGVGSPPRMSSSWLSFTQHQRRLEQAFEREGVKIEWVFFKGAGPAVNEALTNRQLDFTALGDLPSIIGRSVGVDTRLVATLAPRSEYYLIARNGAGIRGLADLRGKRVAFHKGTATQLAANRMLAPKGLSEKDLRVVSMDQAAQAAAFLSGDVDALFGNLTALRLQDLGHGSVVHDTRGDPAQSTQTYLLVAQDFATKYPRTTQRVVNTLLSTAAWASDESHRDEVFRYWGSAGSVSEDTWRRQYQPRTMAEAASPLIDPFIEARLRQSVDEAVRFKLIRRPFDVASWIDRRYLDTALRDLGLNQLWPAYDAAGKPLAAKT
jgi:sulfonate transport system substrate-binding protein